MSRMFIRPAGLSLLALLASTACTQQPAQIVVKGNETYARDGSVSTNSYTGPISASGPKSYTTASSAPIAPFHAADTSPTASVGSIGVTDLAPPTGAKGTSGSSAKAAPVSSTASSSVASSSPFKPAVPESRLAPAAGPTTAPLNPWTSKPREVELKSSDDHSLNLRPQSSAAPSQQLVSEVKKPSSDKAVSQLDSIIGSESGSTKNAAITKQAANTDSSGFMWPVNSKKVISSFGPKGKGQANDGINIASANGEPVWAASDGEVVYVGNELGGYGNMVVIKHNGDKSTSYAHLSRATVDKYDRVKQGDIIGYVGSTGNVKDAQLHFAIREGTEAVDPVKFMKRNVASLK